MRKGFCELCGPPWRAEFTVCRVSEAGKREERNLCDICAKDAERIVFGDSRLPLTDLLRALVLEKSGTKELSDRTKVCPSCGNSEQSVLEAGEVGCSVCYSVFRAEIEDVVRKLHGPTALRQKPV